MVSQGSGFEYQLRQLFTTCYGNWIPSQYQQKFCNNSLKVSYFIVRKKNWAMIHTYLSNVVSDLSTLTHRPKYRSIRPPATNIRLILSFFLPFSVHNNFIICNCSTWTVKANYTIPPSIILWFDLPVQIWH